MSDTDKVADTGATAETSAPVNLTIAPVSTMDLGAQIVAALEQNAAKKEEEALDIVGDSKSFRVYRLRGEKYVEFKKNVSRDVRHALESALNCIIGHSMVAAADGVFPMKTFVKHYNAILRYMYDLSEDDLEEPKFEGEHKTFFDLVKQHQAEETARIEKVLASGKLEYEDLPFYFAKGALVYVESDGEIICGRVKQTQFSASFFGGSYMEIVVEVLHNTPGTLSKGAFTMYQMAYPGLMSINDLSVKKLDLESDVAKQLKERGEKYFKYVEDRVYLAYTGNVVRRSWAGSTSFRADGRVMLDAGTFSQIDSDGMSSIARNSGLRTSDEYSRSTIKGKKYVASGDDVYITWPYMFGFSFRSKIWGEMRVSGLSEIEWRDDAFDKLVLDADEKRVVKALVEHSGSSFADIVEGKGGGCIFMLHGEPGQGKTLTAETVAEHLRRPLYSVSVGELGTDPDALEERLREILDVATIWNAVLLLDEADIFLEARDERDVLRNAMVGVFLRLLEYHQGVMFLTTNRVKNIDRAFFSRISIAIRFGAADSEKRAKIWHNLLDAANILKSFDDDDVERLAEFDLNGRQIKNIIRNSQTLAKAEGESTVTLDRLTKMIELTTAFERNMSGADVSLSATVGGVVVKKFENFRVPGLHR